MNDNQERPCELLELYALHSLSIEENDRFEAHFPACERCQKLFIEYSAVTGLLPLASEEVALPAGMKQRVLARVLGRERTQQASPQTSIETIEDLPEPALLETTVPIPRSRSWRYVSLGLAAAVLVLVAYTWQLRGDVDRLQQQIAVNTESRQGLKVNEAVSLTPAAKDIVAKGLATIVIDSRGTHLVVQAESLPELNGSEAFQVWLIKGKTNYNAGTFVSRDGNGALYDTFEPQDYDTVAITLEPDAKGETPRGQIVLTAPIKNG